MDTLLNFHTHREALSGETAIRALLLSKDRLPLSGSMGVCTAGIHPWDIPLLDGEEHRLLLDAVRHPAVVALGETGPDRLSTVPMDEQLRVFRLHIALSEQYAKPLVIHCVHAQDMLLAERRSARSVMPWAWHGFRGNAVQLGQLVRHGFFFSFGPRHNEEAVRHCPADRLLLETDNSNVSIAEVYTRVAYLRGLSVARLDDLVRLNAECFFGRRDSTIGL